MDEKDVFIGIPFSFRVNYEDLKGISPKASIYFDKIKDVHSASEKSLEGLQKSILRLQAAVDVLFKDIKQEEEKKE
ncbi:hypothetical protein M1293_01780 [Candidatus Parvarchaeota archaeon]|nr:hypothetical protein [Candidatus Parvarchaeota archaeon]